MEWTILGSYVLTVCQVSANAIFNYHSAYQTSDGQHISRFSVNMLTNILLTSPPKVLSVTRPPEVSTLGLQTGLEWHCKLDHNGTIKRLYVCTVVSARLRLPQCTEMDQNETKWPKTENKMKLEYIGMSSRSKENVYITNSFEQIPVYHVHRHPLRVFWVILMPRLDFLCLYTILHITWMKHEVARLSPWFSQLQNLWSATFHSPVRNTTLQHFWDSVFIEGN